MKKIIETNGCRVAYDISRKEGAPAVALLHGYGVHREMWAEQYELLSREYTVINLDVRGHGDSRPCAEFSIPLAADDLHSLLVSEDAEDALLIGLSMGGYVIQEYAFRFGGARGYMLIGDTPVLLGCYTALERFALKHSAGMFRPYPWGYLKKVMAKLCCVTERGRETVLPMFDTMTKDEFIASWHGIAVCVHPEEFQFDAPLLVTCGESDATGTIKKCMPEWEKSYRGCETKMFKNAAHVANLDNPRDVNEAIIRFAERCAGR